MSRDDRMFATHRCAFMPKGYSIRKYAIGRSNYLYPEPGGWVLGRCAWNDEWDVDYLESVTPFRGQHIRFCPWCGCNLGGDA